jgi:hypothetical protein
MDPFEVQDGWFEIILPSLELVVSDSIPAEHREHAELTLTRRSPSDIASPGLNFTRTPVHRPLMKRGEGTEFNSS